MTTLFPNGEPMSPSMPEEDMALSIGTTGLRQYGGHIAEEWLPSLRGIRGIRVYTEMRDNDAIVGALLYLIKALIGQTRFYAMPADEKNPRAVEASKFLESCILDMEHTWPEFMSEVCSMLPFGWALFEKVFKYRNGRTGDATTRSRFDDGKIGWRKISIRGQESLLRWEMDGEGNTIGMWQQTEPRFQQVYIPMDKAILFRTSTEKGNPEGRSILRNAYRSWFFVKRLQEYEATGIERELCGLPCLQVPPEILNKNASADQQALRNELAALVQQIRRDQREGIMVPCELNKDGKPTGYKLTLLSSGGKRQIDPNTTIKRHEDRIAMTVLAEFLMLGQDAHGSFALASSKTDIFAVALGALLDNITETFNRYAVDQLMELNGYEPEVWPKLCHGDIETPPLEIVASYLDKLGSKGFITRDEKLEAHLREIASLPSKDTSATPAQQLPLPIEPEPVTPVPPASEVNYAE